MDTAQIILSVYQTSDGRKPFIDWFRSLKDLTMRGIIDKRLLKLRLGNFGDHKFIHSIIELRLDYGPGYRIYCGKKEKTIVILLCGGDKKSQESDLQKALEYWQDYKKRKDR